MDVDSGLERVRRHIHRYAASRGRAVTLDELARVGQMGKFALIRAFQRCHGMTPHRYVIEVRVRCAKALLARGEPASVAAVRAGFVDQAHLTRRFREIVGLTPSAYARASRERSTD